MPDQAIWLWDFATRAKIVQLTKSGGGGVRSFTFTPVGGYIVCSYGGKPYFIDIQAKEALEIPVNASGKTTGVKIEQTGKDTAAISLGTMQDDDAPTYRILAGSKSPLLVLSRRWMQGYVDVWDADKKTRVTKIVLPKEESLYEILDTALSFDDSLVAVGGKKSMTVWRTSNGKRVTTIDGTGEMKFSPTQNELAVANDSKLRFFSEK